MKKLPRGFAEDARGTLQREMMSYLAIASPRGEGGEKAPPDV